MNESIYRVERYPSGKFRAMTKIEVEHTQRVKRRAYLRDWIIVQNHTIGSKWVQLYGKVFGHPRFAEGEWITTSPVLKLDIPGGFAETMNTKYVLRDDRQQG